MGNETFHYMLLYIRTSPLPFFFFFGATGVWTQGLVLAKKAPALSLEPHSPSSQFSFWSQVNVLTIKNQTKLTWQKPRSPQGCRIVDQHRASKWQKSQEPGMAFGPWPCSRGKDCSNSTAQRTHNLKRIYFRLKPHLHWSPHLPP
jgi:hypothetical protein